MKKVLFLIVGLLSLGMFDGYSKEKKDTIWTAEKDRLIITYDIRQSSNQISIQIRKIQKNLGYINRKKYKELDEVVALLFDRTGNYKEVTFSNMVPEAFMIPSSVSYHKSDEGYFFIQDNPTLTFDINKKEDILLSIPVYLAHYEGKHKYKLFAVAKKLVIKMNPNNTERHNVNEKLITQTVTSSFEAEGANESTMKVLDCINRVKELLTKEDKLPFSDALQREVNRLTTWQDEVKDEDLYKNISETLNEYDKKKEVLKGAEANAIQQAQKEAERQAKIAEEIAKVQQDSIQAATSQHEKEEKKRNLWLIIGGIIFAVLCVVGNQVFQHFRNARNQKSMMEMQQSIVKQAENDAKRRAKSYVRSETNRTVDKTINKGKNAVRSKINKIGSNKNKGNFSI